MNLSSHAQRIPQWQRQWPRDSGFDFLGFDLSTVVLSDGREKGSARSKNLSRPYLKGALREPVEKYRLRWRRDLGGKALPGSSPASQVSDGSLAGPANKVGFRF